MQKRRFNDKDRFLFVRKQTLLQAGNLQSEGDEGLKLPEFSVSRSTIISVSLFVVIFVIYKCRNR